MSYLHGIEIKETADTTLPLASQPFSTIGLVATTTAVDELTLVSSNKHLERDYGEFAGEETASSSLAAIFLQGRTRVVVSKIKTSVDFYPLSWPGEVSVKADGPLVFNVPARGQLEMRSARGVVQGISGFVSSGRPEPFFLPEGASLTLSPGTTLKTSAGKLRVPSGTEGAQVGDDGEVQITEETTLTFAEGGLAEILETLTAEITLADGGTVTVALPQAWSGELFKEETALFPDPVRVTLEADRSVKSLGTVELEIEPGTKLTSFSGVSDISFPTGTRFERDGGEVTVEPGALVTTSGRTDFNFPESGVTGQRAIDEAVERLLDAKSIFGYKPNLIIAPGFSENSETSTTMFTVGKRLRARVLVDGGETKQDALGVRSRFGAQDGSSNVLVCWPPVDMGTKIGVVPLSAAAAGLTAAVMSREGVAASPSNRGLTGVKKTVVPISWDITDPLSLANELNSRQITTVVREGGFRLWGLRGAVDETSPPVDRKNQFWNVRGFFNHMADVIVANHLWALDRGITRAYVSLVTESINLWFRQQVSEENILFGECFIDPEINTPARVADGDIEFAMDYTPVYPAEKLTFNFRIVDDGIELIFS